MTNRLRTEIEEELAAEEEQAARLRPKKREIPDNLVTQFFSKGFITSDEASKALPFIFWIAFLCMIYIGNKHMAENSVREIDKLNTQVKELGYEYKSTKAELAYRSTLSQVKSHADSLNLEVKESLQPPQKIMVKEDEQ
jgi:hypothetical protein